MDTKDLTPPAPYQLDVRIEGCFVFALQTDPNDTDLITSINVYAPAGGHAYSGGLPGQWNNPYFPPDPTVILRPLLMLEPRRYCLELAPPIDRVLSVSSLREQIGDQNLWPDTHRPLGQGWDLAVTLPPPDNVANWITESAPVGDCFGGKASSLFTQIGLTQILSYTNVSSFVLRGSPIPVEEPVVIDGKVTLVINAEPRSIPTIDHQRGEVQALAQMIGLDLYLQTPLPTRPPRVEFDASGTVCTTKTGSCMGGAIFNLS